MGSFNKARKGKGVKLAENLSQSKPTEVLDKSWERMSKKQKEELLKIRGFDKSWAEAKTIKEMVNRGGGVVANDLLHVVREYIRRNPNTKVMWD